MGLNQYIEDEEGNELAYFRKANSLHGWMDRLAVARTGDGLDNGEPIKLTIDDLDQLMNDIFETVYRGEEKMEPMPGFFFGNHNKNNAYWFGLGTLYQQVLDVARTMDKDGLETVNYKGWW